MSPIFHNSSHSNFHQRIFQLRRVQRVGWVVAYNHLTVLASFFPLKNTRYINCLLRGLYNPYHLFTRTKIIHWSHTQTAWLNMPITNLKRKVTLGWACPIPVKYNHIFTLYHVMLVFFFSSTMVELNMIYQVSKDLSKYVQKNNKNHTGEKRSTWIFQLKNILPTECNLELLRSGAHFFEAICRLPFSCNLDALLPKKVGLKEGGPQPSPGPQHPTAWTRCVNMQ